MLNKEKTNIDIDNYNKDKMIKCNEKFGLLLDDYIFEDNNKLFRLVALRDDSIKERFKKGDLGGYVSGKENLADDESSWIDFTSKVMGKAVVSDDSYICKNSTVEGGAVIKGNVIIEDSCNIVDTLIHDDVYIKGNCLITSRGPIKNNVIITDGVTVDNSIIKNNVVLSGYINIHDYCVIDNNVKIKSDGFYLLEIANACEIRDNVNLECSGFITDRVIIENNVNIKSLYQKVYLASVTLPSEINIEDSENLLVLRNLVSNKDAIAFKDLCGYLYLNINNKSYEINELEKAIKSVERTSGGDLLLKLIDFLKIKFSM